MIELNPKSYLQDYIVRTRIKWKMFGDILEFDRRCFKNRISVQSVAISPEMEFQ